MFAWHDEFARPEENVLGYPIDALSGAIGTVQLELLRQIAQLPGDAHDWERWGARDGAHWLSMRMGISYWKAERMLRGARELAELPQLSGSLQQGRLHLDKVLELARFAAPSDEAELIEWASTQTAARIRREAGRRLRREADEVKQAERTRSVNWWFDDGTFNLEATLPAAQGATVAKAVERAAETIPVMPGEEGAHGIEQRRADGLVAICSGRLASDPDPDRATVVIHVDLQDLGRGADAEIEGGGVAPHASVQRLLCDGRLETILSKGARVVAVAAARRTPPAWMVREVRRRDGTCRFPGCDARQFTQVHHLRFWSQGGRTTVEDQALICFFHHRLLHEHGWRAQRMGDGSLRWFWPDGRPHRPGHDPDEDEWAAFARRAQAHRGRRPRSPGPAPRADDHRPARRKLMVSRT
jgi:hypothetical protein